jgi:multiple sugar transport system permease protein
MDSSAPSHDTNSASSDVTSIVRNGWQGDAWAMSWVSILPPLLAVLFLIVLPGLALLVISCLDDRNSGHVAGSLSVIPVSLDAYRAVWSDPEFYASLWTSVVFAFVTVAAQTIFGVVAATSVHLVRPGKLSALLTILYFCPYAVPVSACARAWEFLMRENGFYAWVGSWVGIPPTWWYSKGMFLVLVIASIWQFFPFVFLTTLAQMRRISPHLYKSAQVDGASRMEQVLHVTFPAVKTTLVSVVVLRLAFMFTKFDLPWLLGGNSAEHRSVGVLPVYIYSKVAQVRPEAEASAVLMAIAMLIGAALLFWPAKWIESGSVRSRLLSRLGAKAKNSPLSSVVGLSAAGALLLFAVIPYLTLLLGSFVPNSKLDKGVGPASVSGLSFENYQTISDDLYKGYALHLLFTLIVSFATVIAVLMLSMFAAYALSRVKYRHYPWLNNIPLLGYLFPPIVLVISYGSLLRRSPLNQTLSAVGLAHVAFCLPFGIWLMTRYFEA